MDNDKRKEHIKILLKDNMNQKLNYINRITRSAASIDNNLAEIDMVKKLYLTIGDADSNYIKRLLIKNENLRDDIANFNVKLSLLNEITITLENEFKIIPPPHS
jgi:hypothetical protein